MADEAAGCKPGVPTRARRRDAVINRERIVEAAIALFNERGFAVPVAEIADAAGVGVGTFYRSFTDRGALLEELAIRAYRHLEELLIEIDDQGLLGLVAIKRYLSGSLAIGDRLVLPLHGAPALVTPAAAAARARIDTRLNRFLTQARDAGAVVGDVNATDVILCSSLLSRPARGGPVWDRARHRHLDLFVAGLAAGGSSIIEPVTQADVEAEFARQAPAERDTTTGP